MTTTRVCAHLHTPTDKSVSNTRMFKIERLRLPIVGAALASQKVTNRSLLECLNFSVAVHKLKHKALATKLRFRTKLSTLL